ncbi:hypothetical protein [Mesorhizobium sp. LNHC252B00]|uniref:hypothetical protein n=1 Tax=Mesorhizobium sp. LNHC252B00 TaxID=1287252 RepID=UPI0012EB79D4|nr:hypothetical protein [Mesorhizobium sp. LNHC252B00]
MAISTIMDCEDSFPGKGFSGFFEAIAAPIELKQMAMMHQRRSGQYAPAYLLTVAYCSAAKVNWDASLSSTIHSSSGFSPKERDMDAVFAIEEERPRAPFWGHFNIREFLLPIFQ